ncbi:MAG: SipW-dependent-type signal peptide-containing protein [Bifidobacteriaceae bacterium]|jgi:alternate signal-mediated exported protein|nr:SipW-dependent-type signal peptide-containing protein [Bifidobacteriaceae bacterium]
MERLPGGRNTIWAAGAGALTLAVSLPLWGLLSGGAGTYALWHDSDSVTGQKIIAGDLEITSSAWEWQQVNSVGEPLPGGTIPSGQHGKCLTPEPASGTTCSDGSLPLSKFVAMPGDVIKITGAFSTRLEGDNIAARLQIGWGTNASGWGIGTYTVSGFEAGASPPAWKVLLGGSTPIPVGTDAEIVTATNATQLSLWGGPNGVVLNPGIHTDGQLDFQIGLTLEAKDSSDATAPYPYVGVDPRVSPVIDSPGGNYVFPDLTITLDQIRAGEKFGVSAP